MPHSSFKIASKADKFSRFAGYLTTYFGNLFLKISDFRFLQQLRIFLVGFFYYAHFCVAIKGTSRVNGRSYYREIYRTKTDWRY